MRKEKIQRKTNEVDINGEIVIDGSGKTDIKTGFGPLDHLLTVFAFHGLFDLTLNATGDLAHHIIEDIGIALGKAFNQALGDKAGINRYGSFSLVMDKVVVEVNIDISGRPTLEKKQIQDVVDLSGCFDDTNFTFKNAEEFLESFVHKSGIRFVYIIKSGVCDVHNRFEALF
ncbi:MAG: imidazoleglycerol-phosphate dehydratase [Candidatus Omnitrophota bacterium]